ncbi:LuxR C-terminal-related transcriptional regulator [Elizabethkingia anophelis]|uniref:helix-turn-helix transcriptional regulator n=1 Tax=Elizabethkingia anophelis TaxID=1117645 RepID=UPI002936B360|nr:hypothetical protein [Elizabethkingia anophelis]
MLHKILIATNKYIIKAGFCNMLLSKSNNVFIDHTESLDDLFSKINHNSYDLLILDYSTTDGTNIISKLKNISSRIKIIIYTSGKINNTIINKNKGADAFLDIETKEFDISLTINNLLNNNSKSSHSVEDEHPVQKLSHREIQILRLLIKGNSNTDISRELLLKDSTVSTYKKRIFEKLHVHSVLQLVHMNI